MHPALKLAWVFCHGLASVKLIQHFLKTFPSCASIGIFILTHGLSHLFFFGVWDFTFVTTELIWDLKLHRKMKKKLD